MKKTLLLLCAVIGLGSFTILHDVVYRVGSEVNVNFKASKGVEGVFTKLTGTAHFVPSHLDHAQFDFSLESNSINTGNGMKNKHAMGSDWLNATDHPKITFKSTSFSKEGNNFFVTGNLTLKATTKSIKVPFTWVDGVLSASFTVNRKDYGVDGKGSNKVGDDITIDVALPMEKQ